MTPDQIESAARELCRLRGFEADAPADFPLPPGGKCWEYMAKEVTAFAEVGTAIAHALAPKKPRKPKPPQHNKL